MDPHQIVTKAEWQSLLAVMKPEVLVEALKHHPQLTLLVAPSPVHVPNQPLVAAVNFSSSTS